MKECEFMVEWADADGSNWVMKGRIQCKDVLHAVAVLTNKLRDGLLKGHVAISAGYAALKVNEVRTPS